MEEEKRRCIDSTLTAARKNLSPQTGWVHFCHESHTMRHDTIPLLENFCFILALFRSRLSEDILQGKELLEKILHFAVDGHFPIYLHEYPEIRDPGARLDLLPIFLHLQREFAPVLGERLEAYLKRWIQQTIEWGEKESARQPFSYARNAKLQAAQGKFQLTPERKITSSFQLGEELIALQLQGNYTAFDLQEITRFWHTGLQVYCGPYHNELQEGFTPAVGLLDHFMGQLFGYDSPQLRTPHPTHLRAAFVYPFTMQPPKKESDPYIPKQLEKLDFRPSESPGVGPSQLACIPNTGDAAIAPTARALASVQNQLFKLFGYTWIVDQERQSAHLLWSGENTIHSFVIQGVTNWQALDDSHFVIDCTLSEKTPEHGEDKSEVNCFFNYHSDHTISISGGKASSFYLHEPLSISSSSLTMSLQWSLHEGEGNFFGHLLRGNRPRQILTKGDRRFMAYDWQIALRTVARKGPCTLRLHLHLKPGN